MDVPERRNRTWMFVCAGCHEPLKKPSKSLASLISGALNIWQRWIHPDVSRRCARDIFMKRKDFTKKLTWHSAPNRCDKGIIWYNNSVCCQILIWNDDEEEKRCM